jgi:outer membrane cobalamin receptor
LAGIELLTTFSYNQYLSADFSFGYLNSPGSDREILEHIPKKKFRLGFTGKTKFGFQLNYELSYFDKRITYIVTKNLESYMVHNLNMSYDLTAYLKVRADFMNLTDENFEEELGYPSPGRMIIFGVSVSF